MEKTSNVTLDEQANQVLHRQLHGLETRETASKNSRLTPLSFAEPWDIFVLSLSSILAVSAGAAYPLLTVIFSQLAGTFRDFSQDAISGEKLREKTNQVTLYYVYLAVAQFTLVFISTVGFYYSGERVTQRIRHAYLKATIRQNMAFFDTRGIGTVTNHIASDMNQIQESITSKLSIALMAAANFGSAFVISFIMSWKLALVLCSVFIAMLLVAYATTPYAIKYTIKSMGYYNSGTTIAQEAISSIKDVTASGSQTQLSRIYKELLKGAEKAGIKARTVVALSIGWANAMPCFGYALGFYAGARFLIAKDVSFSGLTTATLVVVNGAFAIVRVIPTAQAFINGIASASAVFETIGRKSPKTRSLKKEVSVLKGVNIDIPSLKTTALVGLSGCGKTSIFGLLERFYEPVAGTITVDGHDLHALNLRWLRNQIGYVGQNPVLFSTSVYENIRHGLAKSDLSEDVQRTRERVIQAAKLVGAHDFISSLPRGYETEVGEKGTMLSGGQRQRIAIARAIVADPKILLLDEATSALDTKSERIVQEALEAASRGRTTIIIAHRLSTIRNADKIVVMAAGQVVEEGTHEDLIALQGTYSQLVDAQQVDVTDAVDETLGGLVEGEKKHKNSLPDLASDESTIREVSSRNSAVIVNREREPAPESKPQATFMMAVRLIVELNKPEWVFLLLGLVFAILAGFSLPGQSIPFAKTLGAFSIQAATESGKLQSTVNLWSLIFTVIGIYIFIIWSASGVFFAYTTERLSRRVRYRCLEYVLRQDIKFFDEEGHSTGAMSSMLSSSASDLAGLGGAVIGSILTFISTIVTGIILSVAIGWKLGLVCTATIPLTAMLGWVRLQFTSVFDNKVRLSGQQAATYASEAVSAIRTVAASGLEDHVLEQYRQVQQKQAAKSLPPILRASVLYATSQGVMFLAAALAFWYGCRLLESHEYTVSQFFICFLTLIWGASIAGTLFTFAPDVGKAMYAAAELKQLFDRQPVIDTWSNTGIPVEKTQIQGHISLRNVNFTYPNRAGHQVLRNCSIDIPSGKFVALVGASGCGKSTIVSLIERFYNPDSGTICLDGQDISQLNINNYRQLFSLVSQDPAIYSGTIRQNLLLGKSDEVSQGDIDRACRDANIYDFIISLPQGFDTAVGSSGTMLSGGQKQRISIARALLRNPQILLLDEATSALDSESEKLVQEALQKVVKSRTTLAIAHRLSTEHRGSSLSSVFMSGSELLTIFGLENVRKNEMKWRIGQLFDVALLRANSATVCHQTSALRL
ncbi:ABC multidrug transporter mdr1 [Cladobotryum mycophilum]|uniref:ABC multidrug transporter mdr1 n=1 Tax=Cladobotryum mycophilum TaxID=491253 RepID=A0ABR0S872_9HYPO